MLNLIYKKKLDKGNNDMPVNEILQQSEDVKATRMTFNVQGTMSYSCGVDAKENGYQSKESTLNETLRAGNTLPPSYETKYQHDR